MVKEGQMEELEKVMFAPCSNKLISGELQLDDGLIGSSASAIESENHSDRIAGKDGPCAGAVACPHKGFLHSFHLHLSDESGLENITKMFDRFLWIDLLWHDVSKKMTVGIGKRIC